MGRTRSSNNAANAENVDTASRLDAATGASTNAPLAGLRAIELAGLAPGPFAGMLLADYGCEVLRLDRPHPLAHLSSSGENHPRRPPPTPDNLTRGKSSLAVDLSTPGGRSLLLSMIPHVDILIDPYRPGVLERLGLDPRNVLLRSNPRLIVVRLTGFRRPSAASTSASDKPVSEAVTTTFTSLTSPSPTSTSTPSPDSSHQQAPDPEAKYTHMAGHDLNYLAISGLLSTLGPPPPHPPIPPGNLIADFAAGGAAAFAGVLLALFQRDRTNGSGRGQVVESNMVDATRYLSSFARAGQRTPAWDRDRGTNVLDGVECPFYRCYRTADNQYVAVGALEEKFYAELITLLGVRGEVEMLDRRDPRNWSALRQIFADRFASGTRSEWEVVFDGSDACVTPVKGWEELEEEGVDFGAAAYVRLAGDDQVPSSPSSAPANISTATQLAEENTSPAPASGNTTQLGANSTEDFDPSSFPNTDDALDGKSLGREVEKEDGDTNSKDTRRKPKKKMAMNGNQNGKEGLVPIRPGEGGEDILKQWTGWTRGSEYDVRGGGCVRLGGSDGSGREEVRGERGRAKL
ncbi:MAG: hypothetical protein M1831_002372 [Alyxoria varia]|nr:MAG: hypothetical protein M1831_002372 [Alyxoria varia]